MTLRTQCIGLFALGLLAACDQKPPTPTVASAVAPLAEPAVAPAAKPAPDKVAAEVGGVDLSKWQGAVDFTKIKAAGKAYVFIKATQGNARVDPDYARNMQGARAAGLAAGSYHFYMTNDKPEAQFANFSRHVSLRPGDLPPVVDIEVLSKHSLPNLAAELKIFLGLIEKKYGVKPILYSGENFANDHLKGFADYPLWLAEYNKDKAPKMPLDWQRWTFWQYSQGGTVAGVAGPVDLDRFNGSMREFQTLLIK